MRAEVKIPKGWRRIAYTRIAYEGQDRWFDAHAMEWKVCLFTCAAAMGIYIRRIKPKKARKA